MSGSDCAICGSIADGVHYGVTSCRSCNAFFRRAVTFNHKYICRKSGHCEVNKHVRCACRACRFKKCLDTGMDRKAVQPPRDPTGSQNKRKRTATVHTPTADKPVTNIGIASTFPATTDISEMESCLDRLAQSYKDQIRMQQLHFTSVESFLSENEKGVIFRQGKLEDMYAMSKVELPALMFWLEKLHPFKQLPMEDR
uniref:Nuclear receptor domain-containing protein n=1 Tax=Plectus sambesii TaxID=2011161 RepID=A0A914XD95_9BILA